MCVSRSLRARCVYIMNFFVCCITNEINEKLLLDKNSKNYVYHVSHKFRPLPPFTLADVRLVEVFNKICECVRRNRRVKCDEWLDLLRGAFFSPCSDRDIYKS